MDIKTITQGMFIKIYDTDQVKGNIGEIIKELTNKFHSKTTSIQPWGYQELDETLYKIYNGCYMYIKIPYAFNVNGKDINMYLI